MKILILSSKLPYPPKDGGAIATLNLAEGLSKDGHEIHMLCLNTRKHFFDVRQIPLSLQKKITFYDIRHDTSIRLFKALLNLIFSKHPYNAQRFYSRNLEHKLKLLLQSLKPDLIQLESPYMGHYIPAIRKLSSAPVSLRAHNVEYEIWQRKSLNSSNPFKKKYFEILSKRIRNFEREIVGKSDFLVAISDRDRNQLLLLCEIKSITIPTGLNTERYPQPSAPIFPSLFYIGALDWGPNQEGIIWFIDNVFLPLKEKIPVVEWHIAGRNAPPRLKEKLTSYKNQGIIFHGEVEDAYAFMNRFAIFVCPLFSGSGIRIKILEGMIMERAVVATSIAAEGIAVSDRKNIFIADNAENMIDVIYELCEDKGKYESIAKNSRKFVIENFNTLATSKRLSEFYRSNLT